MQKPLIRRIQKRKATPSQIEMLRVLEHSRRPVHDHELNGRVAKALLAREWACYERDGIVITDAGRRVLQSVAPAPPHRSAAPT